MSPPGADVSNWRDAVAAAKLQIRRAAPRRTNMRLNRSTSRRVRHIPLLMALGLLPIFLPAHPLAATSSADNSFVIRHARVFDGHTVQPDADVWVEAGTIKAIGKDLKASADSKVVD